MSTVIRNTTSERSDYHLSKERYLELKHFCMQYEEWKSDYEELKAYPDRRIDLICSNVGISRDSFVENQAIMKAALAHKISMIEETAMDADQELSHYILTAVTQGKAYPYLQTVMEIPCCSETYYKRYRRFFWLLDRKRDE